MITIITLIVSNILHSTPTAIYSDVHKSCNFTNTDLGKFTLWCVSSTKWKYKIYK